jgi:hypothetical protein
MRSAIMRGPKNRLSGWRGKWRKMEAKDKTQIGANVATVIACAVTVFGIIFAYQTYKETSKSQKDALAVTLWQNQLKFCAEHPDYADGRNTNQDGYEWFVWHTLHSAETVFLLQKDDTGWQNSLVNHMKAHGDFMKGKDFADDRDNFDKSFQPLIDEAIRKYEREHSSAGQQHQ